MIDPDKRLFYAVDIRNADAVKQALAEGADPNARQETNWTPLYWAAGYGDTGICRLLLEAGADVNAREDYGDTPLHNFYRMDSHSKPCERLLLESGADPEALNEKGQKPKETCSGES
jgi:ankyrin repeat protein